MEDALQFFSDNYYKLEFENDVNISTDSQTHFIRAISKHNKITTLAYDTDKMNNCDALICLYYILNESMKVTV